MPGTAQSPDIRCENIVLVRGKPTKAVFYMSYGYDDPTEGRQRIDRRISVKKNPSTNKWPTLAQFRTRVKAHRLEEIAKLGSTPLPTALNNLIGAEIINA